MNDLLIFYDRQQRIQPSPGRGIKPLGNLQSTGASQLVTPKTGGQRGTKMDMEINCLQSQDPQQVGHKFVVADKGGVMAGQAAVLEGHRLYRDMRPLSGMEELAVKSQDLIPAGCRAFREDQQTVTPA
jgi:hypothetical protein